MSTVGIRDLTWYIVQAFIQTDSLRRFALRNRTRARLRHIEIFYENEFVYLIYLFDTLPISIISTYTISTSIQLFFYEVFHDLRFWLYLSAFMHLTGFVG
jgi:hypothetical protein